MAKPDKARVAEYCKLRPGDNDPVFDLCYEAAIAYAKGAGVDEPAGDDPLYNLLIAMLASTWYDNRGTMLVGQVPQALDRSAAAFILQLRYPDDPNEVAQPRD